MQLQRLAIFGPGLIGGSIALAARGRGLCEKLAIWSPDAAERAAVHERGFADAVTSDPAEAVRDATFVILCTPPAPMPTLACRIAPHLAPGTVVSDVASVKASVVAELGAIFRRDAAGAAYIGAHPMAGAERGGLAAARADLFEGAVCLLTPDARTDAGAVQTVRRFWESLGSSVRQMTPEAHDESVALISHLPHLLAAALMNFVAAQPGDPLASAGPGWRDTTRVAGGDAELWTEILSRNRAPVTNALHGIIAKLREALVCLEAGHEADLERFLAEARKRRESLIESRRG